MRKPESKEFREIATALGQAHSAGNRAGRALHDRVAPLLTGAGLRLQLFAMDQPEYGETVAEILRTLDEAMEYVRHVSQTLAPSVVYRIGFPGALQKLVQERQAAFPGAIRLKFTTTAKMQPELAARLYDAISAELSAAIVRRGVSKVSISVTGAKRVSVRIQNNGQGASRPSSGIPRILIEKAGFILSKATGKGTIVLIRHGTTPRSARG